MATIRKRNGKWHVQIRRKNLPSQTCSFAHKRNALKWIRDTETRLEQQAVGLLTKDFPTFKFLIERYINTVSIHKKGYILEKHHLTNLLKNKIIHLPINLVTAQHIATYRDERLKTVKSSTVLREFNIIQHMFSVAIKEWGILITNPFDLIRKPKGNFKRERRLTEAEYTFLV